MSSHGGARPGSGRPKLKPSEKKEIVTLTISPKVMKAFRKAVPVGRRAHFMEQAILLKLDLSR